MTVQDDMTSDAVTGRARQLATAVRSFVDDVAVSAEAELGNGAPSDELRARLQAAARERGIFAPTAPVDHGGLGLDHRAQTFVLEEAGRSLLGPLALNCAAPDEGNMLLLGRVATAEQRARWLAPLCRGEIRTAFAMTEPAPGAGSDPSLLRTEAARVAGGWRIDGRKWFTTGAIGAAVVIVMARTGDDEATMFLVPAGTPGLRIVRTLSTMDEAFSGGHAELELDGCEVGDDAVLGEVGSGFAAAQVRLGPARLTHCMRWLGAARRAHEAAVTVSAGRPAFGSTIAGQGQAQQLIADNEIDIAASRALVWTAACALDAGRPARHDTSVAKAFVAEAVWRVVDRSMQLCGGAGTTAELPIARIMAEIRPFRIYDGPTEVHRWSIARRAVRAHEQGRLPGDRQ